MSHLSSFFQRKRARGLRIRVPSTNSIREGNPTLLTLLFVFHNVLIFVLQTLNYKQFLTQKDIVETTCQAQPISFLGKLQRQIHFNLSRSRLQNVFSSQRQIPRATNRGSKVVLLADLLYMAQACANMFRAQETGVLS